MGITNPRPTIRKREARNTAEKLRRHAELMAKFEAEGFSRNEASRRALMLLEATDAKFDEWRRFGGYNEF